MPGRNGPNLPLSTALILDGALVPASGAPGCRHAPHRRRPVRGLHVAVHLRERLAIAAKFERRAHHWPPGGDVARAARAPAVRARCRRASRDRKRSAVAGGRRRGRGRRWRGGGAVRGWCRARGGRRRRALGGGGVEHVVGAGCRRPRSRARRRSALADRTVNPSVSSVMIASPPSA